MMTRKSFFLSATFLLSLTLVLGGFIGCGSENPAASDGNLAPGASGVEADDQDPSYVSSITVDENTDDDQLSGLVGIKITPEKAAEIALESVGGGEAVETKLGNENGNVVYEVEVKTESGVKDVKIDPGTGEVLHIEADDDDDEEDEPGGLESNHEFEGEEEGEN